MAIVKQYLLEDEEERSKHTEEKHQVLKTTKKYPKKNANKNCKERDSDEQNNDGGRKPKYHKNKLHNYKFWCYACGGEGYIAANCAKHQDEKKEESKKVTASVAIREHVSLCARRNIPSDDGVWLLDCGASDHMTNQRDLLKDFQETSGEVELGDGAPLKILGKGKVTLHMSDECGGKNVEFKEDLL